MALIAPRREPLGVFPTPFHRADRLGFELGISDVWVKRDDLSGFSWGGNKVRTAEYLIANAVDHKATDLIVCGGPTSNFAAIFARAGQVVGLRVHQVCYGSEPMPNPPALLESRRAGAAIVFTESTDRSSMEVVANELSATLKHAARSPVTIPRGGATALGAAGFVTAAIELDEQCRLHDLSDASVVVPVGSGGSIAGLLAGRAVTEASWNIIGASVSRPLDGFHTDIVEKAAHAAQLFGAETSRDVLTDKFRLVDCRGSGFGIATSEENELAAGIAGATGLIIDATYNAKALLWLARGSCDFDGPVIYWHTGGALSVLPTPPEERRLT